jgi:nucleoid-associated protein Lsr2
MPIMAKTVITQVTDDLDGSNGAETVTFGYEGRSWEIDLSKKNRSTLERALKPYIDAGRKTAGGRGRRPNPARRGRGRSTSGLDLVAIRDWARQQGYTVADRGRISAEITDAYNAAH